MQQPLQPESVSQAKALLRQAVLAQRDCLAPDQAAAWSARMTGHLAAWLQTIRPASPDRPGLALYAAMRNEADLAAIIPLARSMGWTPCYPRIITASCQLPAWYPQRPAPADPTGQPQERPRLVFIPLPPDRELAECLASGHFGVPEPDWPAEADGFCDPDVIILPGLAFDGRGNRLGWGKAYYDCYLAGRRQAGTASRPLLLGAAYPFQIVAEVPAAAHDQRVDYLLTPDGLWPTN